MQVLQDHVLGIVITTMMVTTATMAGPITTAVTVMIWAMIVIADVRVMPMKIRAAPTARAGVWSCQAKPVVLSIVATLTTPIAMCGIAPPAPRMSS